MAEVVYYVAASLDGFIATPGGGIDWLGPFEADGTDYGYAEFYASVDAVVLGRKTYEQCLGFDEWPYAGTPCWVLSRTPLRAPRPDVTISATEPGAAVAALESRGARRIWLVGGATTAAAFRAAGLITDYVVSIVPTILGAGLPLFAGEGPREAVRLVQTTPYPNGLVQLRYRRA